MDQEDRHAQLCQDSNLWRSVKTSCSNSVPSSQSAGTEFQASVNFNFQAKLNFNFIGCGGAESHQNPIHLHATVSQQLAKQQLLLAQQQQQSLVAQQQVVTHGQFPAEHNIVPSRLPVPPAPGRRPKSGCRVEAVQECETVPRTNCNQVPQQSCHIVPLEQCHQVPVEKVEHVCR